MRVYVSNDGATVYLIDANGNYVGRWFFNNPGMSTPGFDPLDYTWGGTGTPTADGQGMMYNVTSGPGVGAAPAGMGGNGGGAPTTGQGDQALADYLRSIGVPEELISYFEGLELDVQPGFDWYELEVQAGVDTYIADLENEIAQDQNEINRMQAETNRLIAESNDFYNRGMLAEAEASRLQAAELERERMALEERLAQAQNELTRIGLEQTERAYGAQLSAHPVNIVEYEEWKRAGGPTGRIEIPQAPALPGAKRGVAIFSPKGELQVEIDAEGNKVIPPGLITVGEDGWEYAYAPEGTVVAPHAKGERSPTMAGGYKAILEQLQKTPPGAQGGMTRPPVSGQRGATLPWGRFARLAGTPAPRVQGATRNRAPMSRGAGAGRGARGGAQRTYEGWTPSYRRGLPGRMGMPYPAQPAPGAPVRRPYAGPGPSGSGVPFTPGPWTPIDPGHAPPSEPPSAPSVGYPIPPVISPSKPLWSGKPRRMQSGGTTGQEIHTDEEMAAMLAGILEAAPTLYDPNLGGRGIYGAHVPRPGEVSRSLWSSMDPGQRYILESFLGAGIEMDGERTAIYVPDWLQQMQRSWIPGLTGAGRAPQYAY